MKLFWFEYFCVIFRLRLIIKTMRHQTEVEFQISKLEEKANEIMDLQIRYCRNEAFADDLNEMLSNVTRLLQNTALVLKRV